MKRGTKEVVTVKRGTREIARIKQGTRLVYEKTSLNSIDLPVKEYYYVFVRNSKFKTQSTTERGWNLNNPIYLDGFTWENKSPSGDLFIDVFMKTDRGIFYLNTYSKKIYNPSQSTNITFQSVSTTVNNKQYIDLTQFGNNPRIYYIQAKGSAYSEFRQYAIFNMISENWVLKNCRWASFPSDVTNSYSIQYNVHSLLNNSTYSSNSQGYTLSTPVRFRYLEWSNSGSAGGTYVGVRIVTNSGTYNINTYTNTISKGSSSYSMTSVSTLSNGRYTIDFTQFGSNPRLTFFQSTGNGPTTNQQYALQNMIRQNWILKS